MHRLTQQYTPPSPQRTRPQWLDIVADDYLPHYLPPSLGTTSERFMHLIEQAKALPIEKTAFGLIHADFSDGNFAKLVEMEGLLNELRHMCLNEGGIQYDGELLYQLKCVDDDIPYLGFFESIYSHEHPFCLTDV